jgi:hypothetical protein
VRELSIRKAVRQQAAFQERQAALDEPLLAVHPEAAARSVGLVEAKRDEAPVEQRV